ncbi:MAG TPA: FliG C-terminal domain-containing protein [Armatimonadota bacterium]|nr:FliG C-terminal domain-containing protein [Armatimonadota bacterium]
MSPSGQSASNSQKAALLIQALGHERAEEILTQLPPAQAERIRQAMRALAALPNETKRAMLRELRVLTASPPQGDDIPYLATISSARAAELLTGEPARLVALLLLSLPAERRQAILAQLPAGEQPDVRARCGELTPPAKQVAQHLEQALRAKAQRFQFHEAVGGEAAREMLAPSAHRAAPAEPAPPDATLPMATLAALDRAVLRDILTRATVTDVALALRGVDHACAQRMLQALPARLRTGLRVRMKTPAPVRLRDITQAQGRLCRLAQDVIAETCSPAEEPAHA